MASPWTGLVDQLQGMEHQFSLVLMEAAMKLAYFTDVNLFLVVETPDGRSWVGRDTLKDEFLSSGLQVGLRDVEFKVDPTSTSLVAQPSIAQQRQLLNQLHQQQQGQHQQQHQQKHQTPSNPHHRISNRHHSRSTESSALSPSHNQNLPLSATQSIISSSSSAAVSSSSSSSIPAGQSLLRPSVSLLGRNSSSSSSSSPATSLSSYRQFQLPVPPLQPLKSDGAIDDVTVSPAVKFLNNNDINDVDANQNVAQKSRNRRKRSLPVRGEGFTTPTVNQDVSSSSFSKRVCPNNNKYDEEIVFTVDYEAGEDGAAAAATAGAAAASANASTMAVSSVDRGDIVGVGNTVLDEEEAPFVDNGTVICDELLEGFIQEGSGGGDGGGGGGGGAAAVVETSTAAAAAGTIVVARRRLSRSSGDAFCRYRSGGEEEEEEEDSGSSDDVEAIDDLDGNVQVKLEFDADRMSSLVPSATSLSNRELLLSVSQDKLSVIQSYEVIDLSDKNSFIYKLVSSAGYDLAKLLANICPYQGEYKGPSVNKWMNEMLEEWLSCFSNLIKHKTIIKNLFVGKNFRKARLRVLRKQGYKIDVDAG